MSIRKWNELKELSNNELIDEHDNEAKNTVVGTQYYVDELRYREQARVASEQGRVASQVERLTWWIARMTLVVTIATLINVYFQLR